jgi:formylglycine-generating enzyme required for sulfatase activity
MVQINGSYWIDTTEVSYRQYYNWLSTNPTPTQPTECAWNTNLRPPFTMNPLLPDRPMAGVDWCDAYAFCAAAGKRLCGSTEGGATDVASINTLSDEWYNACTSGGINLVADGQVNTSCNVGGVSSTTKDVGSITTCTSTVPGYTGVYDLTGNVFEWTNSCDSATDTCAARGSGYTSQKWACSEVSYVKRNLNTTPTVGIRCCK